MSTESSAFKNIHFLLLAYISLLLVIFILPYFSADGYQILKHTISHLGAQGAPNAWIMNLVFFMIGLASVVESVLYLKRYWIQRVALILFGTGLILVSFFNHAPINDISFSVTEDRLHSFFAAFVGCSFTFFALLTAGIHTNKHRYIALCAGLSALILSVLIFTFADYAGFWQRIMFIASFAWILFYLGQLKNGLERNGTQVLEAK